MAAWPFRMATVLALVLLALPTVGRLPPELVWNVTASAPVGLYLVQSPRHLETGDLVLAQPPHGAAILAAKRGYLPLGIPLVKRIAALRGDEICAHGRAISINGRAVAHRLKQDHARRGLPAWQGCDRLGANAAFLLMADVPDSFDGRYFGPVHRAAILGKLRPLWTY